MRVFVIFFVFFSTVVNSHGGEKAQIHQWHKKELIVKANNNWNTEHCIQVKAVYQITYEFKSELAMKFDFHVHPATDNNEYLTEHLASQKSIRSFSGKESTRKPGTYCFDFNPVKPHRKDSVIYLNYRLD